MRTICLRNTIKLAKALLVGVLLLFQLSPIAAKTLDEIQAEIDAKNKQLSSIQTELSKAEADLKSKKQAESSASGEVSKLQNEIDQINATLLYNQLKLESLDEQRKLKALQKQEMEQMQDIQVVNSYISWKTGSARNSLFGGSNIVRSAIYNEAVNTKSHGGILGIAQELQEINSDAQKFKSDSDKLQSDIEGLAEKKLAAEAKLNQARQSVYAASTDVSKIRTQSSSLQTQIESLTKEQQDVLNQEKEVINSNPGNTGGSSGGGTVPVVTGEVYLSGQGRDLYQGHGVGMSQFGALGAALGGWDHKQIVEFYFPSAKVGTVSNLPSTINVDGVGAVPIEDYVAGAGEIPDNACEDLGVQFDRNNIWRCWPKQTILAQMILFRTYGARRSGFVYKDTRGQVYKGGQAKKWAAEATKGLVVTYNGGLADVYYSSDNNQGRGNANSDTVWSNLSGDGTYIPYLRSVNDNSFAFKTSWTTWQWRTNSYTIDELDSMLQWSASSSSLSSSSKSYLTGVKNDIGKLKSISFERDPSNRVKKVVLVGDKGTRKIAGWLYKSAWNIWVGTVKPSGQTDYIYSLTFYLNS